MKKTLAILASFCILPALITCGGDGVAPTDDDDGGNPPQILNVSLEETSGHPIERIRVTGIPADVSGVYMRVSSGGNGGQSPAAESKAFIHRAEDGDFLIVPLNPADPLSAGELTLQVTDGDNVTSNEISFSVTDLPAAPGAFADAITVMQRSLDGWLRIHGTTRDELRNTPVTSLPAEHLPLLVTHQLVDNPGNANSLRALADGDIPLFTVDAAGRDLLDRVVAAAGVVDHLNTIATLVDTLSALPDSVSRSPGRPGTGASRAQAGCITATSFNITNCFQLSSIMNKQYQIDRLINSATRQVENSVIFGASVALAFTPAAGIGSTLGAMIWADQKGDEALANLMPSSFDSDATRFEAKPDRFKEDEKGPGRWSDFSVTAKSKGWSIDKLVLEAVMQVVGGAGGATGNVLPGAGKFGADLTGLVMSEGTNEIIGAATNGSNVLSICPRRWTIDCTNKQFIKATVVSGDAITVDNSAETYTPVKPGPAGLRLETKDAFGEAHTGTSKIITVDMMNVKLEPGTKKVEPGETIDFTATVTGADDIRIIWTTTGGSIVATGLNTATLTTPGTAWDPAIQVKARSSANTGARKGKVTSDPREDIAIISVQNVTVTVSPADICLKPGEFRAFTATVTGTDNQTVTWTIQPPPPGGGSMNGNTYTAPGTYQDVNVIATSVENPTAIGYADVEVSNCSCQWEATFVGLHTGVYSGEYAVRIEPQGFTFTPTESDLTPTISVITGPIPGVGSYEVGVSFISESDGIWSQMDPKIPAPQLHVTSFKAGEKIEGFITGELHQVENVGPPMTYFRTHIDLSFRARFFDPLNPSNPCGPE